MTVARQIENGFIVVTDVCHSFPELPGAYLECSCQAAYGMRNKE